MDGEEQHLFECFGEEALAADGESGATKADGHGGEGGHAGEDEFQVADVGIFGADAAGAVDGATEAQAEGDDVDQGGNEAGGGDLGDARSQIQPVPPEDGEAIAPDIADVEASFALGGDGGSLGGHRDDASEGWFTPV